MGEGTGEITMSWQEFLHMGGYASYVWSSYGIAALLLIINIVLPVLHHRRQVRKLQRQIQLDMHKEVKQ